MIFDFIIDGIKALFRISKKENWISKRLNEMIIHRDNFDTLPFIIVEVKESGFLTKVKGLYAYISFYHMPWKYVSADCWIAIAPSLINKVFYCKIHKIDIEPIAILINGDLPQFKKAELTIGEEYKGLIIKVVDYGVFIDIGYHFDWKCGSLTGLLHRSQLSPNEKLSDLKSGQEIKTIYLELNSNGQPVFSNDREKTDWQLGKPQELAGQIIWAKVVRQPGTENIGLLVRGKYRAALTIDKHKYAPEVLKKIKTARNNLKHGEIINIEVTGFNEQSRVLTVTWRIKTDTKNAADNTISNNLDSDTIAKLMNLKNKNI